MRIPFPPHPAHLIERGAEGVEQLASLLPRTLALLDDAESVVDRAEALLTRCEATVERAENTVARTEAVVGQVEDAAVRAGEAVGSAEQLTARARELLDGYAEPLARLRPTVSTLAETTDPEEVQAIVQALDLLPGLVEDLRGNVIPVLGTLGDVAPDLHGVLRVVSEINEMLGSIPGLRGVRKRVDTEQTAREAAD